MSLLLAYVSMVYGFAVGYPIFFPEWRTKKGLFVVLLAPVLVPGILAITLYMKVTGLDAVCEQDEE